MSLLYTSSNFSYADGEFRKSPEFLDSNHYHQQDYRSTTPETETFLSKYMMLSSNGSPNCHSGSHHIQQFGHKAVKQEITDSLSHHNGYSSTGSRMMLQGSDSDSAGDGNSMDTPFIGFENSMQGEMLTTGNGSALLRQSSSPAEFFSNFGVENGLNFGASSGTNNEAGPSTSRLYNHLDYFFSSGPSSQSMPMSQTAESENRGIGVNGSLSGSSGSKKPFSMSTLASDSWQNASLISGQMRARETGEGSLFCGNNGSRTSPALQNGDSRDRASVLTHHLSLPKTFGEMGAIEKIFQFQSHVPCKIRAKRGCATHPRSIAERVRRSRISERMRKLQDLFPDLDKQTNTADMLDMAVEYIKDLQKQVKALTDTKAKCRCSSSKQKHYSIASA